MLRLAADENFRGSIGTISRGFRTGASQASRHGRRVQPHADAIVDDRVG